LRRRLELQLPRQRGWPLVAIAVSIVVHLLLFLGPIESRFPTIERPPEQIVALPRMPAEQGDQPVVVYLAPREVGGEPGSARRGVGRGSAPRAATPRAEVPALDQPAAVVPPADTGLEAAVPAAERRAYGRVGPEYGQGILWVRPVPINPKDLARRLERDHFEQIDSAVTVIMQAFLDSLAAEPGANRAKLPEWVTTVAGTKFGLDSKWIYIAGLKIPAAVLALLPLPQGSIDRDRDWNLLMDLREDIQQAAQRADNTDEFKRAIREIRERKQRERDLERAQRETPPPPPPKDAPIP
jgi:hypothetical protein